MREYTPTTDEVRAVSTGGNPWQEARFDRWLSAHDREVAARAWDEGLDAAARVLVLPERAVQPDNPYRETGATDG